MYSAGVIVGSDTRVLHRVLINAVHGTLVYKWLSSIRFVREAVPASYAAFSRLQWVTTVAYFLPQAFVAMALMLHSAGDGEMSLFASHTTNNALSSSAYEIATITKQIPPYIV